MPAVAYLSSQSCAIPGGVLPPSLLRTYMCRIAAACANSVSARFTAAQLFSDPVVALPGRHGATTSRSLRAGWRWGSFASMYWMYLVLISKPLRRGRFSLSHFRRFWRLCSTYGFSASTRCNATSRACGGVGLRAISEFGIRLTVFRTPTLTRTVRRNSVSGVFSGVVRAVAVQRRPALRQSPSRRSVSPAHSVMR